MEIKVCGMREPENMLALQENISPDWIGLIFYEKSPRYVGDEPAVSLQQIRLPKVGVFVDESIARVLHSIQAFHLSAIQLHGNESPEYIRLLLGQTFLPIWKVVSVGEAIDWKLLEAYLPYVDRFLFDTATASHGGSGKKFNWQVLDTYPFEKPFFLSGGIEGGSVEEIRQLLAVSPQLIGVDLNSRFEDRPGFKNMEKLKEFKQQLLGQHRE